MMCKRALIFIAVLSLLPIGMAHAESPLLFLYDGSDERAARALTEALVYMGVDYRMIDPSKAKDVTAFSRAIVLADPEAAFPEDLATRLLSSKLQVFVIGSGGIDSLTSVEPLEGILSVSYTYLSGASRAWLTGRVTAYTLSKWDEAYGGSIGQMEGGSYPLCARKDSITHMAWFDPSDEAMRAVLPDLIARWTWPYQNRPTQYGAYLVLEEVYPFGDLSLLLEVGESLSGRGISYAIEVMPMSINAEYPAMKRFCEVLAYLQAKGAAIVLRVPLHGLQTLDADALKDAIRIAYEAYVWYGVYPLALSAPADYLWDEAGLSALRGVKTVLLHPAENASIPGDSKAYADGHLLIAPAAGEAELLTDVFATAVYVNIHDGAKAVDARIAQLGSAPLKSLWNIDNALYIGDHGFFNAGHKVTYDGKDVSIAYRPFAYESHTYDRGFVRNLTDQIESNNRLLTVLTLTSSVVLTAILINARRQVRRQFLVRPEKRGRGGKK